MILLFHGPDTLSRSEEIAKLQNQLGDPTMIGLNSTRLDGRQISAKELIQVCSALPFLSERRLVIVDYLASRVASTEGEEAQADRPAKGKKQGLLREITEYLPGIPETTCLLFNEEDTVSEKHPLYKQVAALGAQTIRHFPLLQGADLERWIMRRAKQKKAQIEPQATKELTVYLGNDTRLLDNELEKLATYAREQPITVQDVHRLVSYVREESIFRFVDALGERNGSLATNLLHQLLEDSGDTSYVLYLLSMIARQFRLLIQVKELVDGRAAPPEIMRALRLNHRFILDKLLQQARNFALEQLEEIYVRLQRIDVGIKTGVAGGELALDLFIAEICASNRDKSGGS